MNQATLEILDIFPELKNLEPNFGYNLKTVMHLKGKELVAAQKGKYHSQANKAFFRKPAHPSKIGPYGASLMLGTSNNPRDEAWHRFGAEGTSSIPANAKYLIIGGEFSQKGAWQYSPFGFRFGIDTQKGDNRGWADMRFITSSKGIGPLTVDDMKWEANTSSTDALSYTDVPNGRQLSMFAWNEPYKPTISKCALVLDVSGGTAKYHSLISQGEVFDLSTLNLAGESLGDVYNGGANLLVCLENRATNLASDGPMVNSHELFIHRLFYCYAT